MTEIQVRYRIYARSCGLSPDAMLAADRAAWPGGCMTGYMLWANRMWRRWEDETGEVGPPRRHDAFDGWLGVAA